MATDSLKLKLFKIQHYIFDSLQTQADHLLGKIPKDILHYKKEYDRDFSKKTGPLKTISKSSLIQEIRKNEVCFLADFHTFHQSQRTALRLMREAIHPNENWAIGLELISSQHQKELDAFQSEEINLETFHDLIEYEEQWGFAWKNYAPLFHFAKENGAQLIALNQPNTVLASSATFRSAKSKNELMSRDQWAAGIITDVFSHEKKRGNKLRMLVLYGELHIASQHLPYQLKKISQAYFGTPLRALSIHQNLDWIYWKLAKRGQEHKTNVIEIKKNRYCIISSPPWSKLQSLVSWAEGENPNESPPGSQNDSEEELFDWISQLQKFGETLSQFLNTLPPSFESISVKTIREADFLEKLEKNFYFTQKEIRILKFYVQTNQCTFIPRVQMIYLGSPTQNKVAELSAIHIFRAKTHTQEVFEPTPEDFFRRCLESAFGFFGSLVINPRRKCDLYEDHLERYKESKSKVSKLTLDCLDLNLKIKKRAKKMGWIKKFKLSIPVGINLGQILGKKIYQALILEKISPEDIRKYFLSKPKEDCHFQKNFEHLTKLTHSIHLEHSKRETL